MSAVLPELSGTGCKAKRLQSPQVNFTKAVGKTASAELVNPKGRWKIET